jgi:hypothetical protein
LEGGAVNAVESYRHRLVAVRQRLTVLPESDSDRQGPPDPKSGERWDRYNVLGHTAEFVPFWVGELRSAMDGLPFGRQPGSTARQQAVDSGRVVGEAELRRQIDAGFDDLERLLNDVTPEMLDRTVTMRGRGEETVRWALESLLVGHLEEHCRQLAELGQRSA